MKSLSKSSDLTANMPYYSRPIRRIQDFDESKDHCPTLKNTLYPHQRYAICNTLVNDEDGISFTSIRRIYQEDTAYLCLHSPKATKDIKTNTLYPVSQAKILKELGVNALALSDRHPTYHKTPSDRVNMDDPNITMEEYIRLEEEKARRHSKVYNWETATYDLKTDSKNDNDKVNMPFLPSPEPTVSYFDDLDFFKDFENEFPSIVYNDAQTSKSDLLAEPSLCTQHINDFNLKDETSFPKCDEEEQNVICFN
nr:hypothetical protein [Tanacetum cinerariifolium]